jgi:carboxypeptidase PM20D1
LPPRNTAIGDMSAALTRLDTHRLPADISGPTLETFQALAPEMDWPNRIALSNLWLLKPLILATLKKSPTTAAAIRTTTALTMFNAGNQDNVLPGNATATVNFRLLPGATQAGIIDYVRTTIGNDAIDIVPGPANNDPPPVTRTNTAAYRTLDRTIREIFPDVVVAPGLMVAATDSRHYTGVTDT